MTVRNAEHGGALDRAIAEFGGKRADWLDLSTGINPRAYPIPDMPDDVWRRLPDEGLVVDCLEAARSYYTVPDGAAIVAAPGTQALIQRLPLLCKTDSVAVVSPTYNEYAQCFEAAEKRVHAVKNSDEALRASGSVIVCNPNNPDGRTVQSALVESAALQTSMLVVDEAFGDVVPGISAVPLTGNQGLTVLRSFGKFFGLAGLRLGFAIGEQTDIEILRRSLGPWAVPGPALYIGAQAMKDAEWIGEARAFLASMRTDLEDLLKQTGFAPVGSTDLFVTVQCADAADIARALSQAHILVRSFSYAPTWLRFGLPKDADELQRLATALLA